MAWIKALLGICSHRRYTWPRTDAAGHCYVACLDGCMGRFAYDMQKMQRGGRI